MSNTIQLVTNSIQPELKLMSQVGYLDVNVRNLNDPGVYVIIGKRGCGKTLLINDLIEKFQTQFKDAEVKILYNNSVEKNSYSHLSFSNITFYKNSQEEMKQFQSREVLLNSNPPALCIIPETCSYDLKHLQNLVYCTRHLNVRVIIELSTISFLPPSIRCNCDYIITFSCYNADIKKLYNVYKDVNPSCTENQLENYIQSLDKYQTLWIQMRKNEHDGKLYIYTTELNQPQCSWCNKLTQGGSLCDKCKEGRRNRSKKRKLDEVVHNNGDDNKTHNSLLSLKDMATIVCDEKEMIYEKLMTLPDNRTKVRQIVSVKMDLIAIPPELVKIFHNCLWNDPYSECSYKYVYVTQQGLKRMYDTIPKIELVTTPEFAKVKKMALMFNSSTLCHIIDAMSHLPWFTENVPFFSCAQPFLNVRFLFYSDEPISNPHIHAQITGDMFHISIRDDLIKKHADYVVYLATNERIVYADPTLSMENH